MKYLNTMLVSAFRNYDRDTRHSKGIEFVVKGVMDHVLSHFEAGDLEDLRTPAQMRTLAAEILSEADRLDAQ